MLGRRRRDCLTRAQTAVSLLRQGFGGRLQSAALFGSRARGDAGPESDLDLLIVLAERKPTDSADAARTLDDAGSGAICRWGLLIWSSSELASHPWLRMDVATDGIILLDDGRLAQHCGGQSAPSRVWGASDIPARG